MLALWIFYRYDFTGYVKAITVSIFPNTSLVVDETKNKTIDCTVEAPDGSLLVVQWYKIKDGKRSLVTNDSSTFEDDFQTYCSRNGSDCSQLNVFGKGKLDNF